MKGCWADMRRVILELVIMDSGLAADLRSARPGMTESK
jgi:hypothetical protein